MHAVTRAALQVAAKSLRLHPLRSALSTLGVVMGVASLVAVLAIGDGIERYVREQIEQTTDLQTIVVRPRTEDVVDGLRIPRTSFAHFTSGTADSLAHDLGERAEVAMHVAGSALLPTSDTSRPRAAMVAAVTPRLLEWRRPTMLAGRVFGDADFRAGAMVATISDGLAELALPGTAPADVVGRTVTLSGTPLQVTGVIASPREKKVVAFVPVYAATAAMVPSPVSRAASLLVRATAVESIDSLRTDVARWLAPRFGAGGYVVEEGPALRLRQVRQGVVIFKVMMGAFAGISLVVGGIGIMNVLLAAVLERTREIGVRKAVGARRRDILVQFLSESAVIAAFGAALGIALGLSAAFLVSWLMRRFAHAPVQAAFSWPSVLTSAAISVAIGLAFGMYPALRAARLSPVDAMRTE